MKTLAQLERNFDRLQRDYLILRIAYLESLLGQRSPGMYEVEFDLRKLSPEQRATLLEIQANMQAREARDA